jgi:hypothetical protein
MTQDLAITLQENCNIIYLMSKFVGTYKSWVHKEKTGEGGGGHSMDNGFPGPNSIQNSMNPQL